MTFSVLYVCTGNICRSPMAELLFRGWADPAADVDVSSAGLRALVGHTIDRGSASALGQLGIDPTRHRARQFEPWMAADADLILTADRSHRDRVMTEVPSAFRRTFTMREFARLLPHVPPARARSVVAAAAANRSLVAPERPEDDDVPDPYRGSIDFAKVIAGGITDTVRLTLDMLGFSIERMNSPRPLPYAP